MSDLTPPPEQPMDDATRARIRARLAEATAGSPPDRFSRWLVPVGAAAAVLLVAFGVSYAALTPGGDGSPMPAGSSPTTAGEPSATPSRTDDAPTTPTPVGPVDPDAQTPCAAAVRQQLGPDASQVAIWSLPKGEAAIWVSGNRSVLCEDSDGIATAHQARPVTPPETLGPEQLEFSSSTYVADRQRIITAYVAGGPLPEGVTGIDYTFPDGHTESARFFTGDVGRKWWFVGYVPQDGPMADPQRNILDFDPVRVTVSLSGVQQQHELHWGQHDCAQVNHGC